MLLAMLLGGVSKLAQTNPVPLINQPLVPDATAPGFGDGFTVNRRSGDRLAVHDQKGVAFLQACLRRPFAKES